MHVNLQKFFFNLIFVAEVKRLQKLTASDQVDSVKQELFKLQQYTIKLERQMKVSLANNGLRTSEASLSMEEYTQLTSEVERLNKKCKNLKNQLSTVSMSSPFLLYNIFFFSPPLSHLSRHKKH